MRMTSTGRPSLQAPKTISSSTVGLNNWVSGSCCSTPTILERALTPNLRELYRPAIVTCPRIFPLNSWEIKPYIFGNVSVSFSIRESECVVVERVHLALVRHEAALHHL